MPPAAEAGPATQPVRSDTVVHRGGGSSLRTWSYVSFGVGAVGLGVGTVFALGAKNSYGDANALCPSFPCDLTQRQADERSGFESDGDRKRALSVVGFALGGVGIATGVTLLLLSSRQQPPATGFSVKPLIGLGTVGVSGGF
jgi:hypothetical protein